MVQLLPFVVLGGCGTATPDAAPKAENAESAPTGDWLLPPPPSPPDLVLVIEQGLRVDLGGTPSGEAAFFGAALRKPALRFTHAFTASVSPFVATASALTGRYPSAIPICSWGMGAETAPWCAAIPADAPTLPEVLGLYGYATALFSTAPSFHEHATLDAEFAEARQVPGSPALPATVDAALAWWTAHAAQPRLLVVTDDLLHELRDKVAGSGGADGFGAQALHDLASRYLRISEERGAEIGRLLTGTVEGGPRPAYAFVTSGTGSNLGERTGTPSLPNVPLHRDVVLERTMHVPLAVYAPDSGETRTVAEVVELLDLLPTLARLGGAIPPANLVGVDLLTSRHDPARVAYAEFGDMFAVRSATHLLLARVWQHGGTTLDPELTQRVLEARPGITSFGLHEVEHDPYQKADLLGTEAALGLDLYRKLLAIRQGPGAPSPDALTPERIEALRTSGTISYF